MAESGKSFRRFAIDVYASDGVQQAALLLQERCGVDVNVLLLAAFVGAARGSSFDGSDCETVRIRTRPWQDDVVGPLRALGVRLKDGPPPAPNPATAQLRERIKALELEAELVELDELADAAHGLGQAAAPGAPNERAASAMTVVVRDAAGREPDREEAAAVVVIASAAARFGKE